MWRKVDNCRLCGHALDNEILYLGDHAYGTEFPTPDEKDPPTAPLILMECGQCGLLQMGGSVDPIKLYTKGYGYRSGINETMRKHLAGVVECARDFYDIESGDTVLDIACNDGTLLDAWGDEVVRVGIDPIAQVPQSMRRTTIKQSFFSADAYPRRCKPAKVVTSIACLYDVEDPCKFARDVASVMAHDGIWIVEVMHAGAMLAGAWDMLHHEHVCYFRNLDLLKIIEQAGMGIVHHEYYPINGGTVRIIAGKGKSTDPELSKWAVPEPRHFVDDFSSNVQKSIDEIRRVVELRIDQGKKLYLLGASQKGNTILQACDFSEREFQGASERNPVKHGRVTPITRIPIVSEEEARANADCMLVLPWHFKNEIVKREKEFLEGGGELIFPLPEVTFA